MKRAKRKRKDERPLVEMRPLLQIKPYERNPRTHPEDQIALLAQIMKKRKFDVPIVIDEDGVILKGHARRVAAIAAGLEVVPTIMHSGLSADEKRAIRIEDNQVALMSAWDDELLRIEIGDLRGNDFDISQLGFDNLALAKMFIPDLQEELDKERELSVEQRMRWHLAWRRVLEEWDAAIRAGQTEYTKASLAVYFLRAQLYNEDIPRCATLAYTPHRLLQCGDGRKPEAKFSELCRYALANDGALNSIIWATSGKPLLTKLITLQLGVHSHRYPPDFPPLLARDLINEFCSKDGSVLDPCHGWGGRALGFLLSKASNYFGFDVDRKTVEGVAQMIDDLRPLLDAPKEAYLRCEPYEDAPIQFGAFDFALTSPPYYDRELYDGDNQSWRRYPTFEEWTAKFYLPLIEKTMDALRPGGVFALQIGNQFYPLEQLALDNLSKDVTHIDTRPTEMTNSYAETAPERGELVMLLQKKGGRHKHKKANGKLEASSDLRSVKVSAKMARIAFTECGPDCIKQNGCKGNCCKSPGKPGGCFVTVHPDEQTDIERAGAVVKDGMIVPAPGTRGCPFHKADGLCSVHGTSGQPFGCIASPFTLNRNGTLIIRNRYTVLPCHLGPGKKFPAYQTFRSSLLLLFGKTETERITAKLDSGSGDFEAMMPRKVYDRLMENDAIKRRHKR